MLARARRAAEVVGLQALAQVALVAGCDALEQAGDFVDEQVGVGGHRLQARHGRLVALVRRPDQLENTVAPAGVAGTELPGQVQPVEAGDAGAVDADVDVGAVLLRGDALTRGDPVMTGFGPVGDCEVLGNQLVAGECDVATDCADAAGVDGFVLGEAVVNEQHEASAAVQALQLDHLRQGSVELRGLQVLLERGGDVLGAGVITPDGDCGPVAQDVVGDGVDIATGNAVAVEGFELALR